ncbi:MAG: acyltransferase [Pseudomonadota bacterium]
MKKEFSIYLDLVRFMAAVMVVIYHSNLRAVITEKLPFSNHGHAAVIVFFVLSGYVISFIHATRESQPVDYWSSRLARFYSLALPAVLLCPLLDMAGEAMAPKFYVDATTHSMAGVRIVSSLLYLNEVWTASIMSFSNVPYWSLCYEMWYYVLFAIVAFTRGKARILLVLLTALLLGPKILVLAPLWMLGVVLHRWRALERLPAWQYWLMFLASWPLYAAFQHYELTEYGSQLLLQLIGPEWHRQAAFSKFFIMDYPLALIIAANFIGFRGIAHVFARPLLAAESLIRWLSAYTFALYLLHQPLLLFFAALFDGDPNGKLFYAEVIGATLLTIGVAGAITEHKRRDVRAAIKRGLLALTGTSWWRRGVTAPLAAKPAGELR